MDTRLREFPFIKYAEIDYRHPEYKQLFEDMDIHSAPALLLLENGQGHYVHGGDELLEKADQFLLEKAVRMDVDDIENGKLGDLPAEHHVPPPQHKHGQGIVHVPLQPLFPTRMFQQVDAVIIAMKPLKNEDGQVVGSAVHFEIKKPFAVAQLREEL